MSNAHDPLLIRRLRARFIALLLLMGVWLALSALPPFGHPQSLWMAELPILIAAAPATLAFYRLRHGFWPWDRKRRKIERWRWLVERPEAAEPAPRRRNVGAAIFALIVVLATISTLTTALLR